MLCALTGATRSRACRGSGSGSSGLRFATVLARPGQQPESAAPAPRHSRAVRVAASAGENPRPGGRRPADPSRAWRLSGRCRRSRTLETPTESVDSGSVGAAGITALLPRTTHPVPRDVRVHETLHIHLASVGHERALLVETNSVLHRLVAHKELHISVAAIEVDAKAI